MMRDHMLRAASLMCCLVLTLGLGGCVLAPAPDGGNGGDVGGGDTGGNGGGDNGGDTGGDTDGDTGGDTDGQPAGKLAIFSDPDSDFTTTDVHDVDDQIVQFNTETNAIIWGEDGQDYQAGSWIVSENFPEPSQFFQIRFGSVGGERRAYFTETGPATICDIRVSSGFLSIFATNVTVPQE